VFLLGLIEHNLADLATLPQPAKRELSGTEASIELLRDEKLRAEFHVTLKKYLATLDSVLPRPEALPYVDDAKVLSYIQARAQRRYRGDEPLIGSEVGAKVRALIDEHIESQGIDQKVPPISITDTDFDQHIESERSPKARASEMEHALRHHIRKHFDEDPVHYTKLSERLDAVLASLQDQWDQLTLALKDLVADATKGREADDTGLDPQTEAPFYDVLKHLVPSVDEAKGEMLRDTTLELVARLQREIKIAGFWKKPEARRSLSNEIVQLLDDTNLFEFDKLEGVAEKVMQLAKANHDKLVRQPATSTRCPHGHDPATCTKCRAS